MLACSLLRFTDSLDFNSNDGERSLATQGGGGGGSFLNELNKGPTYSQLLGNSGGGFGSKLGIFSSLLGSSSGGGVSLFPLPGPSGPLLPFVPAPGCCISAVLPGQTASRNGTAAAAPRNRAVALTVGLGVGSGSGRDGTWRGRRRSIGSSREGPADPAGPGLCLNARARPAPPCPISARRFHCPGRLDEDVGPVSLGQDLLPRRRAAVRGLRAPRTPPSHPGGRTSCHGGRVPLPRAGRRLTSPADGPMWD